jgi:quercetin dioxygenase-like cupin family protein
MKTALVLVAAAALIVGSLAKAEQLGTSRTDLQRHDLGIPGREVVQVRVDLAPGALAPNQSHPGEEIVYVIEGLLQYQLEGEAPVTLRAGEVLFIPAGKIHSARNVGKVNAAELATYIVEKESRSPCKVSERSYPAFLGPRRST